MNRILLALAALAAVPCVSQAEENPLSFNVSLSSDYRYRGISQSRLKPALQGGVDYALPNGFYIGTWASTIQWIKDAGGDASVEWDLYGGYKGTIQKGLGYDVGVLTYAYPSNSLNPNADTTEIYGAASFGPATLKYSHSVTNLFGFADSKNSGYLDLSASFDLGGGFTLAPHGGRQRVAHNSAASYTDYSVTASKDFAGFTLSAGLVGANTDAYVGNGKDLGRDRVLLGVKKVF